MAGSVPGFLKKTFEIFSNPAFSDCCGWGSNGDTIVISKIDAFAKNVLPQYFKHSNYQSFVRQLNMYDFHKTVQDPSHGEFQHPFFKQGRYDLLINMKRKLHSKPVIPKMKKAAIKAPSPPIDIDPIDQPLEMPDIPPPAINADGSDWMTTSSGITVDPGFVMVELAQHKRVQDGFNKKLKELEVQSGRLLSENAMLKQVVMESKATQRKLQEKLDQLVKVLYSAYINSGVKLGNSDFRAITDLVQSGFIKLPSSDFPLLEAGGPTESSRPMTLQDPEKIAMSSGMAGQPLSHLSSFDKAASSVSFEPLSPSYSEPPSPLLIPASYSDMNGDTLKRLPPVDPLGFAEKPGSVGSSLAGLPLTRQESYDLNLGFGLVNNPSLGAELSRMNSVEEWGLKSSRRGSVDKSLDSMSDSASESIAPFSDADDAGQLSDQAEALLSLRRSKRSSDESHSLAKKKKRGSKDAVEPVLDHLKEIKSSQTSAAARMQSLDAALRSQQSDSANIARSSATATTSNGSSYNEIDE